MKKTNELYIMPKRINRELQNLAGMDNEVCGVLITHKVKNSNQVIIDAIQLLNEGNSGTTASDTTTDEFYAINKLLEELDNYGLSFIEFHTHPKGTIDRFGEKYRGRFSDFPDERRGDLYEIAKKGRGKTA